MSYIKFVFINIFRSLNYTIPLLLIFSLTTGLIILTDNARRAGNLIKEKITLSYITAIEVIYTPPFTLSGNPAWEYIPLTWEDIEIPASFPHVKTLSFSRSYPFNSPHIWEVNFNKADLNENDIIINNQSMMGHIQIYGVQNTQFNDSLKLLKGRHIIDDDNNKYIALISTQLAELHELDIGDIIFFAYSDIESNNDLLAQKYEIVGIMDCFGDFVMYMPYSTMMAKYVIPDEWEDVPIHYFELNNVKFVLESPDMAAEFINKAIPYFEDMNYILQADDYEYKREIYPIEMMINLNFTLYIACIVAGTLLLSVITIKSAYSRLKDIVIMRFLSCKSIYIFFIFLMEKCIIIFVGFLLGFIAGILMEEIYKNSYLVYDIPHLGISINAILFIFMIMFVCVSLISVILISTLKKKPMEAITHE